MNIDSTPVPAQPPNAKALVAALGELLTRAEAAPGCAPLLADTMWLVSGPTARLRGYADNFAHRETGQQVLEAARALLGGEIAPTSEWCGDGHRYYNLTTTVAAVEVILRAPVPEASVEAQLRERIADLVAAAAVRVCGEGQ
ncbi:hypothetical protein ABT234_11570 [Streptomyces sp. NPDC001586]|uniref:hypothetical protein n=1 Tax=Streptomyces sp. NPDC001586 TaxID=3154387 RepID=UPI00331AB067